MDYQKQANDFAKKHNVKLNIISHRKGIMWNDDKTRNIFELKLSRGKKSYSFEWGQSIANGDKVPTMYDVLACMQKYDVGTFKDFCSGFGYDPDEPNSKKTYKAVVKEYEAVERLFGDIMDELQEIE